MKFSSLAVLALADFTNAFQLPSSSSTRHSLTVPPLPRSSASALHVQDGDDEEDDLLLPKPTSFKGRIRSLFSKSKKSLAFLALASAVGLGGAPQAAEASAPVMAMPKADVRDPLTDALENHQRRMQTQAQEDLRQFNLKSRQIEAEQGTEARLKFEDEYKANQEKMAAERLEKIKTLKYSLLDQGICPFADMEGQRQVFEAEKGIDPADVAGTPFYVEKEYDSKSPQKSYAYRKQANRAIVKAMVEDMKNRGLDPLEYFERFQEKTLGILDLPSAQAAVLASKYQANLDQFGQIVPPKEGEMSAKERMEKEGRKPGDAGKAEAKRLKAEAKAKAKAEAKAAKEEAKAQAKAEKEALKKEKAAAKAAAAAAAAAAATAAATASTAAEIASESVSSALESAAPSAEVVTEESAASVATEESSDDSSPAKKAPSIPIVPVGGVIVALGGGAYGVKTMKDKAAAEEEERQRQFKLLMGGLEEGDSGVVSTTTDIKPEIPGLEVEEEKPAEVEEQPVSEVAPKKKKRRGIKSVFGQKKNGRETDITALVTTDSKAPEFAKLLAKILTFGAPGRFPEVIALPGDMPLQEFETDSACTMLTEAQESAGLTKEDAAETFANVVNCMLIDIVDLASTSLKEKDNKLTVDAIGIVVDFMNHAASLYNSIAEGVAITPVTYGGDLSKSKLEQMYSAYATSGMTNMMGMDEDFENRVRLLQDVFQINEKKAEGLMMKAMQKNMMEMLQSGEGMEGMEEMMKGMGMEGMGGMPGMEGFGDGEPSPEQLKELLTTLKTLKDTGAIPPEELAEVKKQFRAEFGSSIEEVIKEADGSPDAMGTEDKELLDLMKSVLYD